MEKQSGIRLTTDEFIRRARIIHKNKYDYSLVDYKNAKTKVTIICSTHGEFEQTPDKHLIRRGCPECGKLSSIINATKTTEQFIKESNLVHNNKYNYSKTVYVRSSDKVVIICPEHGEFEKNANKHLLGEGCQICGHKDKHKNRSKSILEKRFKGLVQPEDYKLIPLGRRKFAKVDNSDFDKVKGINWHLNRNRYVSNRILGSMHRLIMNPPEGMVIDHIDGDGLNNRRYNLRICTQGENTKNQQIRQGYTSKYKGVCWNKNTSKWFAQIKCDFKQINIGYFSCEIEAAKEYDKKATELFGEFAHTNF